MNSKTVTIKELQLEIRKLRAQNREFRYKLKQVLEIACMDPLTKLGNRKTFDQEMLRFHARSSRNALPFAVLVADVNLFKEINDTHGHLVGDDVLAGIATVLKEVLREGDVSIRYGGDEFVALLHDTNIPDAALVAERFRKAVEEKRFLGKSKTLIPVTVSIGVSVNSVGEKEKPEMVFKRADDALYEAKKSGRNKVCVR